MAQKAGNIPGRVEADELILYLQRFFDKPIGESEHNVLVRLFAEGYLFDFFQAVRLLEKIFARAPSPGETFELNKEKIRFRPYNGLVFPATDVKNIELFNHRQEPFARITSTFLGLYGVNSPLPGHYFHEIAGDAGTSFALRDFLDIFNHRYYTYFYRSWKKFRAPLHYQSGGQDTHSKRLFCLMGVGTPDMLDNVRIPAIRLVTFAGRIGSLGKNPRGLIYLISEFLNGVRAKIIENIPRIVRISSRPSLGNTGEVPAVLGETTTIGQKLLDVSGKFRIVLGPLTLTQYLSFLPDGKNAPILQYLVRLYVPNYLDYDIELTIKTSKITPVQLGNKRLKLGKNSWLGRPEGEVFSHRIQYANV